MQNHTKVIPFRSPVWTFLDYGDEIEAWYQGLSEEGQDTFRTLLKINAKATIPEHWNGCKMLQGKYKRAGLWEWRFRADNRQQRLIGIFDKDRTAVFLIGCYHKQNIYMPAACLDTAMKRAREVRNGRARLNKREAKTDF